MRALPLLFLIACKAISGLGNDADVGENTDCGDACVAILCGDGVVAGAEECDDGNDVIESCGVGEVSCVVCGRSCKLAAGTVTPPCLDCAPAHVPVCGDGVVEGEEECDDTSLPPCPYGTLSCKHCGSDCTWVPDPIAFCGNGVIEGPETCDEGDFELEACPVNVMSCEVCDQNCQRVPGETSFCGDGDVEGSETCELGTIGCGPDCLAAPGYGCSAGVCTERKYRFAMLSSDGLRIRDITVTGVMTSVREILRGLNETDPKPAWAPGGNLVTYPTASQSEQTYLYEPTGPSTPAAEPPIWLNGHETSFGSPPTRAIVRDGDGYRIWNASNNTESPPGEANGGPLPPATLLGMQIRVPQFEPGSSTRFAFINAANNELRMWNGSIHFNAASSLKRFVWRPSGGHVAFVNQPTGCEVRRKDVLESSVGAAIVVATNAPCDALLAYAPSGDELWVSSGRNVFRLALDGTVYDLAANQGRVYQHVGPITDIAMAPDGSFLALLAAPEDFVGMPTNIYLLKPGASNAILVDVHGPNLGIAISPVAP